MRLPPATIDPSPVDATLLWGHGQHRIDSVWTNEAGDRSFHVRGTTILVPYHELYRPYLEAAGLLSVVPLVPMNPDASLITALVERWRPETSTFHLPCGEVTITLEDVVTLSGLAIDGDAVVVDIPDEEWSAICLRLLGRVPYDLVGGVAVVRITWLRVEFSHLPDDASQEVIEQFARAYALSLIGGVLFPDRSGSTVHLQYLLLIEDWERAGGFAWGAAVLSYLYREMGRSTLHISHTGTSLAGDLGGWVALLQFWAWERFPHLAPRDSETRAPATEDAHPRGLRWLSASSRQYGDQLFHYKLWFDAMDTVVWQPYRERALHLRGSVIQSDTFRAVVPLICFSSVMWHHPDRVLRQFGMRQHEPHQPHPEAEVRFFLRQATRGPSRGQQLVHASRESLDFWNRRHEFVATSSYTDDELAYHSEHMEWYRDITRRSGTRRGAVAEALYDTIEHAEVSLRDGRRAGGLTPDQCEDLANFMASGVATLGFEQRRYPDLTVPVQPHYAEPVMTAWPERTDPTPDWVAPEPQFRQERRPRR
ncbi:unnamed protein product, partial [Linum tenue]